MKKDTKFTKETARAAQKKSVAAQNAKRAAGGDVIKHFINRDAVDLIFVTPYDKALDRLAKPKTIAEKILADQMANEKTNWTLVTDIMDRVIGKPRQQVDANIEANMNITLDTTGLYGDEK